MKNQKSKVSKKKKKYKKQNKEEGQKSGISLELLDWLLDTAVYANRKVLGTH